jgi:hypothetical protein
LNTNERLLPAPEIKWMIMPGLLRGESVETEARARAAVALPGVLLRPTAPPTPAGAQEHCFLTIAKPMLLNASSLNTSRARRHGSCEKRGLDDAA